MLAGCTTTPTAPPQLDLPPATADRRSRAARALVDRVRRSDARQADRRGAREQPRPARRDRAHRPARAQVLLVAVATCIRASTLGVGAARIARRPRRDAIRCRRASRRTATTSGSRCRRRTSSTCGASTARRRAPRRTICSPREYARETVRTVVAADVARAYFNLLAADAQLAVLRGHAEDAQADGRAAAATATRPASSATTTCARREAERAAVVGGHRRSRSARSASSNRRSRCCSAARRAKCSRRRSRATSRWSG